MGLAFSVGFTARCWGLDSPPTLQGSPARGELLAFFVAKALGVCYK